MRQRRRKRCATKMQASMCGNDANLNEMIRDGDVEALKPMPEENIEGKKPMPEVNVEGFKQIPHGYEGWYKLTTNGYVGGHEQRVLLR